MRILNNIKEIFVPVCEKTLKKLRDGTIPDSEVYHTIHEFGRANFLEARVEVERFLRADDPELRSIALEVLTRHWHLADHWDTATYFLEHDDDTNCRMMGISALGSLKRNPRDRKTLTLLARVVRDEHEKPIVREAAYTAMLSILNYNPQQQFHSAARGIDLEREVDWKMVDSYLREMSDTSTSKEG